jgi:DNA-binding CsgD family transcriptional regulator
MDFDTFKSRAQELPFHFDAFILGTGIVLSNGSVKIDESAHARCHDTGKWLDDKMRKIDESFVREYDDKARDDVVGELFAAYPRLVQVVSVYEYKELRGDAAVGGVAGVNAGRAIAKYLNQFGIKHLMLCGIDSAFGLAWITFYRREPPKIDAPQGSTEGDAEKAKKAKTRYRFSPDDAEVARYKVPALLYEWQQGRTKTREACMPRNLLPLTFREMQVAIMASRGMENNSIAVQIGVAESTVRTYLRNIGAKLEVTEAMTLIDAIEGAKQKQ